jgi:4-hydroxybenzoyl-CoA reductase subunit beta
MGTIGGNLCQDNCCIYYSRSSMMRQGIGPCLKSGGDVCHVVKGSKSCWATYCGDIAPVLLALGATVTLADAHEERVIPLRDIFSGRGEQPQSLSPSQIVTGVHLPPPTVRSGGTYLKMRIRKTIDYPLLGVAVSVSLEDGSEAWKDVTIGLTAVEKSPLFVPVPAVLTGEKDFSHITEALAEASFKVARPIANAYGYSPGYRREMVKVYVKQAMRESRRIALGKEGPS